METMQNHLCMSDLGDDSGVAGCCICNLFLVLMLGSAARYGRALLCFHRALAKRRSDDTYIGLLDVLFRDSLSER